MEAQGPHACLEATPDMFGGLTVNADALPQDAHVFKAALAASLEAWRQAEVKGVWLKVPVSKAHLVGPACELGLEPHHAERTHIMLTIWLPADQPSMLPEHASHQLGVGAVVVNEKRHILMVQEAHGPLKGKGVWKVPTGSVSCGEDLTEAVEREVLEETGIRVKFSSVLAIRQAHGFAFGKSDMFVMCACVPEPGQDDAVRPQESELDDAKWMPLEEYEALPFQRGVALYDKMRELCLAYADGRYKGFAGSRMEGGVWKSRTDLLLYGSPP